MASQRDLARLFHVAPSTINAWLADGAPAARRRRFDVGAWIVWRVSRAEQPPDVASETRKLRQVQTQLAQLKLDKERGDLVPAVEVNQTIHGLCRWLIGILARSPAELCLPLQNKGHREIKRIMVEYHNQRRVELCERLRAGGSPLPAVCESCPLTGGSEDEQVPIHRERAGDSAAAEATEGNGQGQAVLATAGSNGEAR